MARRSALPFLSAGLLATVLLGACSAGPQAEPVRPVLVMQPGSAETEWQAFSGEVRAREEPALAFRVGGKIVRRLVDVGDRVQAGQALAELDPSDLRLQQQGAAAALAAAEADLELARVERDRVKSLLDRQLVSRSLYDTREAAFRAAQARVNQARAQASAAGNQAAYTVLRAPRAGAIAQRLGEAGQVVAAGQTVFTLAADGEREVAISVSELDVGRLRVGQELVVELWAAPGRRLPGRLREVAPMADPQGRTFAARVSFDAGTLPVEVGQSARVYAPRGRGGELSVPMPALREHAGGQAVFVVDPATSKLVLRPVRIGRYDEATVPVLSGLRAGEWVVVAGVHLLREGQAVKPVDRDNRAVALAR